MTTTQSPVRPLDLRIRDRYEVDGQPALICWSVAYAKLTPAQEGVLEATKALPSAEAFPVIRALTNAAGATCVRLSADGNRIDTSGWCTCPPDALRSESVYYERHDAEYGRAAHGWACPSCRRIVQTG